MPNSLSRKRDYRNSLMRNLATSLILYEEIKTTQAKAKAVKPIVEHLLQIAKKDNLVARRRLLAYFFDEKAASKVFEVYLPRYKDVKSGFIKLYRIGPRVGDSSEMVILKMGKGKEIEKVTVLDKENKEPNAQKTDANKKGKSEEKTSFAKK